MKKIILILSLFMFNQAMASEVMYLTDYASVGTSVSNQSLGDNGTQGDILVSVTIIPTTVAAGTVSIKDGTNTAIPIFKTGTLVDLKPIVVSIMARSSVGAWQITTGANETVIATGRFR